MESSRIARLEGGRFQRAQRSTAAGKPMRNASAVTRPMLTRRAAGSLTERRQVVEI
jgi:hypothetical protein